MSVRGVTGFTWKTFHKMFPLQLLAQRQTWQQVTNCLFSPENAFTGVPRAGVMVRAAGKRRCLSCGPSELIGGHLFGFSLSARSAPLLWFGFALDWRRFCFSFSQVRGLGCFGGATFCPSNKRIAFGFFRIRAGFLARTDCFLSPVAARIS